jgi:hypothetical protein
MKFIAGGLAAIALSASIAAGQGIALRPGETLTLHIENGRPVVEQTGTPQPMSNYEMYIARRAQAQAVPPGVKVMPPGFAVAGEGPPDPPHPSGDRLQITMRRIPAIKPGWPDNTILLIENGYASKLAYRAVMHINGRSAATDVCDVPPHLLGLEHWPYVIDELDISELRLLPDNGQLQCG